MAADTSRRQRRERSDQPADRGSPTQRVKKRPWQLLSVKIAIAITVLGAGMWIYAFATQPAASTSAADSAKSGGDPSSITSGFAAGGQRRSGESTADEASNPSRAVDTAAPATLRIGASFLGAFALGMIMRKFLRWSLLIVGIAALSIFLLRKSGMINMPWDEIEGQVREGATWMQSQAGSVKEFLTGYLPSSAAALVGGIIGFWRG